MDLSLIIFVVVVLFFTYRGYRHGLLRSLSGVLSLVAGYISAFLYTKPVSVYIEQQFQLKGLLALMSAAILLFLAAGIAVSILFRLIKKLWPGQARKSSASAIGGAVFGLALGIVVSIVIVWAFAYLRDMQKITTAQTSAPKQISSIEGIANRAAAGTVRGVLSLTDTPQQVAKLSTALVEAPAEITQRIQNLSSSNDLQALLQDPDNQEVLDSGDVEALRQLPEFQQLINNPDMQALAVSAGMMDKSGSNDQAAEIQLATQLSDIWHRVQNVKNDPQVQEILNDPEFQNDLQSGNSFTLLTDTRMLQLADIVFSDRASPAGQPVSTEGNQDKPKKHTEIYHWIDEQGREHFSNTPLSDIPQ